MSQKSLYGQGICLEGFRVGENLPAAPVKLRDDQGRKLEIVGEEAEALVGFLIVEYDVAQILRIVVG